MAAPQLEETWQYNKSVLERNKYMLENQLATDVTFLVGKNPARRIPAHQYVLISNSPVFYSMFCGVLKERGEVEIPDITPDTFTQMLRYLYYEEADVTCESVMEIMYSSKKYLIPGLTKKCTDFLEKTLTGENAATILEQCLVFEEKELVAKCMKIIGEKTDVVLESEGFGNITNDTLVKILESDSSSVSEVKLFQGSVEWARHKISGKTPSGNQVRNTLGKALFKLRFPVMTVNQFANVVVPHNLLSKDEEILCFRYISQDKKPQDLPFPTKPRIDNSCEYIHLKWNKYSDLFNTQPVSNPEFTIHNYTSSDLSVIGFSAYEDISCVYYKPFPNSMWKRNTLQTQSAGTCHHNKSMACITFAEFKIPPGHAYNVKMNSGSGWMFCTQTNRELTFADVTGAISVAVEGNIPITEILIAKSKT